MNKAFEIFVEHWHQIVVIWSQITLLISGLIIGYYLLIMTAHTKPAAKYKFINKNEIKYLWYTTISLAITFSLFLNSLIVRTHVTQTSFVLIIKTFISLIIGFAVGYAISIYLNVYYPFHLEKRLAKLRFKKRISPKTGKEMRLLNEDEEDLHLTAEMIEQENISAFDYDVWLDEETGYKLIEQYEGNSHALLCNNCRFRTLKEYREELIKEPSKSESGKVIKYYKCSHCENLDEKEVTVAPLDDQIKANVFIT